MGSSSSKQTNQNHHKIPDNYKAVPVRGTIPQSNFERYNIAFVSSDGTPYSYGNKPTGKSFNDLSRSTTSKSNDLSKTVSRESATSKPNYFLHTPAPYNQSNVLSKTVNKESATSKSNDFLHTSATSKPNDFLHTSATYNQSNDLSKTVTKEKRPKTDLPTSVTNNFAESTNSTINRKTDVLTISFPQILTKDDFPIMWFSWKDEFLKNMRMIDQENNKKKWSIMLLNRLGPIGQEIYRNFTFDDGQVNDDIDVLFEKFDQYCRFRTKKRINDEDIDMYINNLKVMASKYTTNVDEIVKKKILEEIDVEKFTTSAKALIPGFSFASNTKSLTIQEITYIWMKYENVDFKKNEKIVGCSVKNCNMCSLNHIINRCPALGKKCSKCGNMNHHYSRCPSQYKENCSYCGESHFYRQCFAYMNECSKCHRLNHFYWTCGFEKTLLHCKYCGLSHIASKSACHALFITCSKCNLKGHVAAKCVKR